MKKFMVLMGMVVLLTAICFGIGAWISGKPVDDVTLAEEYLTEHGYEDYHTYEIVPSQTTDEYIFVFTYEPDGSLLSVLTVWR